MTDRTSGQIDSNSMTTSTAASSSMTAIRTAKRALRKSMATKLSTLSREDLLSQSRQVTRGILASPTYQQANRISIYVSMASGEIDTDELCMETIKRGKRLYVPLFAAPPSKKEDQPSAITPNPTQTGSTTGVPSSSSSTVFLSDMRMLRLYTTTDYAAMKLNKWGIREPEDWTTCPASADSTSDEKIEERRPREDALDESTGGQGLDLILAPGVAFDSGAGRLGHGKGYYDRYLERSENFAKSRSQDGPVCVALGLREQVLPQGEKVPADERDRALDGIVTPDGLLRATGDQGRWKE